MGRTKRNISESNLKPSRPMLTPESQENEMIYLANKLARQQLEDGTASSQVIAHFLKLGSSKERLEREKLEEENKLLRAKTEALQKSANVEELYSKAIAAMQTYSATFREEDSN